MQMPTPGSLENVTVLLVADAIDSIEPLVESFRAAGAVVVAVRTAALALAYADRHSIHAILVDLRDANWWHTPEIRALRAITRAPLYGMTVAGEAPDSTSVAGLFAKPVNAAALVATLSALPRRRR